jgi:hypothetical protein
MRETERSSEATSECSSCLVATASFVLTGVRARAPRCRCTGCNASSGVALLLVVYSTQAVGAAAGSAHAGEVQVPRARYAGRRGNASRGRHLFASDEEPMAGLDV